VHFRARANAVDEVLGGEVDVPAGEEDGLVVEGEGGEGAEVAAGFVVLECVRGAEAPVGEAAGCGAVGCPAGEGGRVRVCEAGGAVQVDGRLGEAGVAGFVFWESGVSGWGGGLGRRVWSGEGVIGVRRESDVPSLMVCQSNESTYPKSISSPARLYTVPVWGLEKDVDRRAWKLQAFMGVLMATARIATERRSGAMSTVLLLL
jgi:hypothetical protein